MNQIISPRRRKGSAGTSALQIILLVVSLCLSTVLLATRFKAAQVGGVEQLTQREPQHSGAEGARMFAKLSPSLVRPSQPRPLSLEDRIGYQHAIEEVWWRHRIWPKERSDSKPPLDEVMSSAQIEKRVEDDLRRSQLLADYWHKPLSAEQLQAEMERMAQHTKQPEVLRELFAALGNDSFVIAECLARPIVAQRLVSELYSHDPRFHGDLKRRAESELRTHQSVKEMKRTSGAYSEMEWVRSHDAYSSSTDRGNLGALRMDDSEWQENVEKLAAQFGTAKTGIANPMDAVATRLRAIPIGKLGPLQEDEGHYYATAVLKKSKDGLKLATVAWLKEPLESWAAKAETEVPVTADELSADYTLPKITNPSTACTGDTWTATSTTNAPAVRYRHTAVWTGSEMIVWGGYNGVELNTGGRYNPSTDSWTATNTTNAPAARQLHSAVWTGSEMIVWGGVISPSTSLNTGGKYNPGTDSWTATNTTGAPTARSAHTAVWTGSVMIIWGGNTLNTGGRYNPGTDSWTATNTTNAASARHYHTAVWTGTEMIVWGGLQNTLYLNSGGKYNPSTNSWTATTTTNAPPARTDHTAVWSGSEMIVWGGYTGTSGLNAGGRYNPGTDSWTATGTTNAPSARWSHTAVWTGLEMIVWGGFSGSSGLNTGGRYHPDCWSATNTTNAPLGRYELTAVWTGSEVIVWGGFNGGYLNTGGKYCAQLPTGTPMPVNLSGSVTYCTGTPRGASGVTVALCGDATGTTTTNGSGNYMFTSINLGNYTLVTPSKTDLPGVSTTGMDTTDALAVQRHFLGIVALSGCGLSAGDVDANGSVNTTDALAIQQFFLFSPNPLPPANRTGQWQFTPANRIYAGVSSDQTGQDYTAYGLGDVNGDLVFPSSAPDSPTSMSTSVPVAIASVSLSSMPVDASIVNFTAAVTASNIDAADKLVGFQGDFTFDSSVVGFQNPPVARAGLTASGNWALAANVLGTGKIKILRVSCFALDAASVLSGEGPLFELRMNRVSSQRGTITQLVWEPEPNDFIFIDENLKSRTPLSAPAGDIRLESKPRAKATRPLRD